MDRQMVVSYRTKTISALSVRTVSVVSPVAFALSYFFYQAGKKEGTILTCIHAQFYKRYGLAVQSYPNHDSESDRYLYSRREP
jgi:hypothetical protein